MPVLITAGLSAEAQRLRRVLGVEGVVLTDESELPRISGIQSVVLAPHTSASYVHEVLKACLDLAVTQVYPLKWGEIIELAKARALFSEFNIALIIPSDEWLRNCDRKFHYKGENISILENGALIAGAEFPGHFHLENETGVFTWATREHITEYSLYVIEDAGV